MNFDFRETYFTYYPKLVRFATEFVSHKEDAENITQDVFLNLWERQGSLNHIENMNAYIFRLAKNKCLDHLKRKTSAEKYAASLQNDFELELKLQSMDKFEVYVYSEENMESRITEAINSLPERCRKIFMLSRSEGLKYREISERLGVSVNTVENQMSIALKKLKTKLRPALSA